MADASAIVLLSGGLDSVVSLAVARERHDDIVCALTFDYGQRAAAREIASAARFCRHWEIPHEVIALPWLAAMTATALVNRAAALPRFEVRGSQFEVTPPELRTANCEPRTSNQKTRESAQAVWVPNRNGIFVNIAAAMAESRRITWIVTGFNAEEAATFPDNSAAFVERANAALALSTLVTPQIVSYTQSMTKAGIAQYACTHEIPLHWCWPCYEGGATWCGRCESCARFRRAVEQAGRSYTELQSA